MHSRNTQAALRATVIRQHNQLKWLCFIQFQTLSTCIWPRRSQVVTGRMHRPTCTVQLESAAKRPKRASTTATEGSGSTVSLAPLSMTRTRDAFCHSLEIISLLPVRDGHAEIIQGVVGRLTALKTQKAARSPEASAVSRTARLSAVSYASRLHVCRRESQRTSEHAHQSPRRKERHRRPT